jgi:hypothetical protein
LTKDNLSMRNWHDDKRCCFCNTSESIEHLFFDCYMVETFGVWLPML